MSTQTTVENWFVVKQEIDSLLNKLQARRDYEEEVSYDPDFADMLTTAIDGLLPLMPTVIPNNY